MSPASRGRESITIVTSNKDILRETMAHSDIRQSASDLALNAHSRCLGHHAPTLRERYQAYPGAWEQERGVAERGNQLSKESFTGEPSRPIDRNQATCQPALERREEPSHSLGMSR